MGKPFRISYVGITRKNGSGAAGPSIRLRARELHHFRPLRDLLDDEVAIFGGRKRNGLPDVGKLRLKLRLGQNSIDLLAEPLDNRGWRVFWHANAEQRAGVIARYEIGDEWDIG